MCFNKLLKLPYVLTLLLICTCIVSISTQRYPQSRRFNSGQRYVPAPVYPDPVDYNDNNQYSDYVASAQSDPFENRRKWDINAVIQTYNYTPTWVSNWPSPSTKLGQVSAVSIDMAGQVVVFHRGDRIWDHNTFLADNRYWNTQESPIAVPTIAVFNSTSGQLVDYWGENLFYLPHGLTVDSKNNVWVTDVALHQVMKFLAGQKQSPSLTLGVRFTPGNDIHHFCKPSAVAVLESGEFFVADGYCNTRIIKYSAEGQKILQWGRSPYHGQPIPQHYSFAVPHALAVAEDKGLLYVADRENGRVQCFFSSNGTFVTQYHSPDIGAKLFSVAYSPVKGGQLYVVNGPEYVTRPIRGFVIDIKSNKVVSQFGPDNKDFSNPHDIAVTKDGREVYVVELDPYKVHKFVDQTIPQKIEVPDKKVSPTKSDKTVVANSSVATVTSTAAPAKPTATVEGLALNSSSWGGWAGVAGGVAGGLGAVLLLLLGGAALLARARHHRGCLSPLTPRNRRQRWDYAPGAPDFKLRHLLERPRGAGFERINTEESDEEPTPATSMLAPQNA